MSRRSRAILISGLTAFAATAAVALLCIRDWSGITGWAFLTMLWSETVFVAGLLFAERASELTEPVATRAVLYTVIAVYAVVNMAVSLLYMILFKKAYTSFGVIQVVLLAAALVITIVSFTASKGIRTEKLMCRKVTQENLIDISLLFRENLQNGIDRLRNAAYTKSYQNNLI